MCAAPYTSVAPNESAAQPLTNCCTVAAAGAQMGVAQREREMAWIVGMLEEMIMAHCVRPFDKIIT